MFDIWIEVSVHGYGDQRDKIMVMSKLLKVPALPPIGTMLWLSVGEEPLEVVGFHYYEDPGVYLVDVEFDGIMTREEWDEELQASGWLRGEAAGHMYMTETIGEVL